MVEPTPSLPKMLQYLYDAALHFALDFNPHRSFGTDIPSFEDLGHLPESWISEERHQEALKGGRYISATVIAVMPSEGFTVHGTNLEEIVYACALHCSREIERVKREQAEFKESYEQAKRDGKLDAFVDEAVKQFE
jgi:hypothetical protein